MTAVRMTVKKLVAILAVAAAACSGGSSTETSGSAGRATDAPGQEVHLLGKGVASGEELGVEYLQEHVAAPFQSKFLPA